MGKNVYDGKTNIGGMGQIEGPYTAQKAPAGKVATGNDLRTGRRGGRRSRK